ncbi:MAG: flavin reductase family protein [Desulfuromonadaceae bacterium]
MKKRQLGPCVTFFPQPTTLISSVGSDGQVNIMTASWVGVVSKTPPTMGISLNRKRRTYEQIQQTRCFAVNLMPASLATAADYCGLRSGRDEDKLVMTNLSTAPGHKIAAPLLVESTLNIECVLKDEVALGEYRLLLGEIVEIHAIDQAFAESGAMDARSFDPLVYLGGIREYWNLGEKQADAYHIGRNLFTKLD